MNFLKLSKQQNISQTEMVSNSRNVLPHSSQITYDYMVEVHESEWTPGVGDGQGGLACCDSWGRRVGHVWATELNWTSRLKGLNLVHRVSEELWTEVHNTVQEEKPKPPPRKRNARQSNCWRRLYKQLSKTEASLVAQMVKHLPTMLETWVWSLGQEDPLEKEMATNSSIRAWKIPWTKEPGGLQAMGFQRVGHDWATHFTSLQTAEKGREAKGSGEREKLSN